MKRGVFFICTLTLVFFVFLYVRNVPSLPQDQSAVTSYSGSTVSVGEHVIEVELAQTDEDRTLGLGNRATIADDAGMLFVFPERERHGIWMKGMLFPLDIIWLTSSPESQENPRELTVVDMREHVLPATYPEVFLPGSDALYVLELPAGTAAKTGIAIGTILTFKK